MLFIHIFVNILFILIIVIRFFVYAFPFSLSYGAFIDAHWGKDYDKFIHVYYDRGIKFHLFSTVQKWGSIFLPEHDI